MGFLRDSLNEDFSNAPPLWLALEGNHITQARALLEAGAELDTIFEDDWQSSILHRAAEAGDWDRLNFLLNYPCPITLEAFDYIERTPLICAAHKGRYEAVERLLEAGANPNAHNEPRIGDTAIRRAVSGGHHHVVALLLKAGADPWISGWMGLSAMDKAWSDIEGGLHSGPAKKIQALLSPYLKNRIPPAAT